MLTEDLISKMPEMVKRILGSKKYGPFSNEKISPQKAQELVINLGQIDPSRDTRAIYIEYILNQYLKGNLRNEDRNLLADALEAHYKNRAKLEELGEYKDINVYKDWRELYRMIQEKVGFGTVLTDKPDPTEIKTVLDLQGKQPDGITLKSRFQVLAPQTPEALFLLGQGSAWCTANGLDGSNKTYPNLRKVKIGNRTGYPTTAASYLKQGQIYVAFKDNELWWQATHNFSQFFNTKHESATIPSAALDYILAKLQPIIGKEATPKINAIRKKCPTKNMTRQYYELRPPITESKSYKHKLEEIFWAGEECQIL